VKIGQTADILEYLGNLQLFVADLFFIGEILLFATAADTEVGTRRIGSQW